MHRWTDWRQRPRAGMWMGVIGLIALVAAGCGGDEDKKSLPVEVPGETQPAAPAPLSVASMGGCAIDADCAEGRFCFQGTCAYECTEDADCGDAQSCSSHGECLDQTGEGLITQALEEDAFADIRAINDPNTVLYVSPGQSEVTLHLEFDAELPDEGLPYRIERSDAAGEPARIQRTEGGVSQVDIAVPVGQASPEHEEAGGVRVEVVTALRNYEMYLRPAPPIGGKYYGQATAATFGSSGLPLEFDIVTKPDGATLQDAETAWLVLPVASERLFSPIAETDGAPPYMTAELVYDDFVQRWVAVFENGFDLTTSSVIALPDAEQVRRTIRVEIEPYGKDQLIGTIKDIWTGLYEVRSEAGVTKLEDVLFEGDLTMKRERDSMSHADLIRAPGVAASPDLLPAPPLDQCADAGFYDVEPVIDGNATYDCEAIASQADFEAAAPAEQASCAIAVAHTSLAGDTTASQIRAFLDENVPDPEGMSFSEFIDKCADGTDGYCVPADEVLCSRQLLGFAYRNQGDASTMMSELVGSYQEVTREAYLGQQLGAFGADADKRLEWLKTTDYPAVVTSAVENLNEQLLQEWATQVLDVHLRVLNGQLDPSGLAVLSREVTGADALDARQQLLTEMAQSWRGAMEALTLAASRYHSLFQDDARREEATDFVTTRMFDLYLAAGVLRNLNLSAGVGYLSAGFGTGFSDLLGEASRLAMPYDKLVYARDAEVVVNTSVDPQSNNDTLLAERRRAALDEIIEAQDSVQSVLAQARAEALDEEQLRNRMNNEINDLRDDLVEMCGMPVGCTAQTFRTDPSCRVRVAPGKCGYAIDKETEEITEFTLGSQNVSEAGRSLLDMTEAAQNLKIAVEEKNAFNQRLDLAWQELTAFEADINAWNVKRLENLQALEDNLAQREQIRNETLRAMADNFAQRAGNRQANIADSIAMFEEWDKIRMDGVEEQMGLIQKELSQRHAAAFFREAASTSDKIFAAMMEGIPKVAGMSNDVSSPARAAVLITGTLISSTLDITAAGLEMGADAAAAAREKKALLQEAEMAALEDEAELDDLIGADELETLKEELRSTQAQNDAELALLRDLAQLAQTEVETELAYERDFAEFRRRRTAFLQMMTESAGLNLRVVQAQIGFAQAMADYLGIVQRAQLADAKLEELMRQRANINRLVGSPAVIFSRANRLRQAELRLERAKEKLMEWLVALEYYAVRPFMDQRLQILLARNPYQLEEIAEKLDALQRDCGGATNELTTVLSVRDDLLGFTRTITDSVTGETLSPADRLRRVLEDGYVPVDKRVRYSTDESIGGLLGRGADVLAATFFVDLSDFANLGLTCNAKVASVDLKLVGDGLGDARPTVSLLYDGTSQLRSCQPGIDDYVAQFGEETTNYGSVTYLRTAGRSISPVAGINEFPGAAGQANQSLGGLPLASQYTLLIDKAAGENAEIDWSKLEDIEVELTYTYQDVFPAGQCE
ncbi:hypothetical protein FIV42_28980 [Persicimonas caeni]|uniref:Uncharacterized protein n=1 Tax=Persicimonas caeni TaxID=2292766 RepID=A0A4Y6Q221_PERCE|nr:dickkopf-related protein [Persicimonas caeni]QDG54634.1 hypothetical protein FIV42_28980 [Persicimonas caeni]QED35855.1 hypothetical protein FRD00_28975 [Persicimonas caeni]